MIFVVLSSCVKVKYIPSERKIFDMQDACIAIDKNEMQALYKNYLNEIFADLCTCREKGLLKK